MAIILLLPLPKRLIFDLEPSETHLSKKMLPISGTVGIVGNQEKSRKSNGFR